VTCCPRDDRDSRVTRVFLEAPLTGASALTLFAPTAIRLPAPPSAFSVDRKEIDHEYEWLVRLDHAARGT